MPSALQLVQYFPWACAQIKILTQKTHHTSGFSFPFFCHSCSPFSGSRFLLWFCWPFSRLCSCWKSFHLNAGESELFQQRVSMVGKVMFFFDFGGKIPRFFVCISGPLCFLRLSPTLSAEYQKHLLA